MEEKRSCCCGELPALWWWLLTLLGLPLLFLLMTGARQGTVEADLTTRGTAALKAAGMDWATVNLDQRGRDAQLNGMAISEADRDAAFKVVQGVYGVREVQNLVEVAATPEPVATAPVVDPLPVTTQASADAAQSTQTAQAPAVLTPPSFSLQTIDGKVVLQGVMGSQQDIDAAVSAAQGVYGAAQVDNQLQLTDGIAPASWLSGLSGLLPALQGLENVVLNISADGNSISGQLPSDADKATLLAKAQQVLGDNLTDQLMVEASEPTQTAQATDAAKAAVPAQEEQAVMDCQQQLNDAMQGKTILFETNKSAIKRDSIALLDSLVGIVSSCKDVIAGRGIQVSGHTDNVGNDAYNQKLSEQRAGAVKDYTSPCHKIVFLIKEIWLDDW
ncbi:MAG: BON domain-containing protein [Candidatus Thiothrix putei]|uniref:BON domain-containing protein n=1 Tax=Candidatus Thiothrix putei TaxID=3080811 RepID=A0AA95HEE3_9GAMM|nr:MAG: BON domain-containing protein [Candidatus Thiothrix putei]